MSGLRAARSLRGSDASAPTSSAAAALLAAGDAQAKANLSRWLSAAKSSKQQTSLSAHRRAWLAEERRIGRERRRAEEGVEAACAALTAAAQTEQAVAAAVPVESDHADADGEANAEQLSLRSLLAARASDKDETRRYAAEMWADISQAKQMLQQIRAQRAQAPPPPSGGTKQSKKKLQSAAAATAGEASSVHSTLLKDFISTISARLEQERLELAHEEKELMQQLQPLHALLLSSTKSKKQGAGEQDPFADDDDEDGIADVDVMDGGTARSAPPYPPSRNSSVAQVRVSRASSSRTNSRNGVIPRKAPTAASAVDVELKQHQQQRETEEEKQEQDEVDADGGDYVEEEAQEDANADGADEGEGDSVSPQAQQTFLTATKALSLGQASALRSPRGGGGGSLAVPSARKPSIGVNSQNSSVATGSSFSWPVIPPIDPALPAVLPNHLLTEQERTRTDLWESFRSQRLGELEELEQAITKLREDYTRDSRASKDVVARSDASLALAATSLGLNCSWSSDHQARLRHLVSSYRSHGKKRAELLDRLKIEFAGEARALTSLTTNETQQEASKTKTQKGPTKRISSVGSAPIYSLALSERVELLERGRALAVQKSALQTAFDAEHPLRVAAAIQAVAESDRAALVSFERAREAQLAAEQQMLLHAELDALRAEKQARDEAEAIEAARRAEEAAEIDAARAAREALLREQQKQLLSLWHAHQAAEALEASRAQERLRQAAAEQARLEIEAARPNVEKRQEQFLAARREAALAREREAREAAEAREARLEALRALVLPNVERDPERMKAATASSAAAALDELSAQNPLFQVHGYDMTSLLKDQRFRLQLALWNAGVHQSDYAKSLVQAARPAVQPRVDMQSTVFSS